MTNPSTAVTPVTNWRRELAEAARVLMWPTLTLVAVLIPGVNWIMVRRSEASDLIQRILFYAVGIGLGLSAAWFVVRLIDACVWRFLERRVKSKMPRLLKDVVAASVFIFAITLIIGMVFKQSVTGLWATSGIISLVVGFALKSMIADVFCGIALNFDQPFKLGQWVKLHPRGMPTMEGAVLEVNWRSTRLRSMGNNLLIVPNSEISTMIVTNYSEPQDKCRFDVPFCLDFQVPPERAIRILMAGARAAAGILETPAPSVNASKVSGRGVEYVVRFWIKPAEMNPEVAYHNVITGILRHLNQAGVTPAYDKQDIFYSEMPTRHLDRRHDRAQLLRRIELFGMLEESELELLSNAIQERRYVVGSAVVRQGEAGSSMFVLVEGLLDVRSDLESGRRDVRLKYLEPGEFFGEMSLLTGEPRTATVTVLTEAIVYEIGKAELNILLSERPEIAVTISRVVAQRRQVLRVMGDLTPEEKAEEERGVADQILRKMRGIFGSLRQSLGMTTRAGEKRDEAA